MNKPLPRKLIFAGILLLLGGFVYDIKFAGIPFQDPTPEMSTSYDFHSNVAAGIRWTGFGLLIIGIVVTAVRLTKGKRINGASLTV